jgi:hypothetical protein
MGFGVFPRLLFDSIHRSLLNFFVQNLYVRHSFTPVVSDEADHESVDDLDLAEFGLLLAYFVWSEALVIPLRRRIIHRDRPVALNLARFQLGTVLRCTLTWWVAR